MRIVLLNSEIEKIIRARFCSSLATGSWGKIECSKICYVQNIRGLIHLRTRCHLILHSKYLSWFFQLSAHKPSPIVFIKLNGIFKRWKTKYNLMLQHTRMMREYCLIFKPSNNVLQHIFAVTFVRFRRVYRAETKHWPATASIACSKLCIIETGGQKVSWCWWDDERAVICYLRALRARDVGNPKQYRLNVFFSLPKDRMSGINDCAKTWAGPGGCYRRLGEHSASMQAKIGKGCR